MTQTSLKLAAALSVMVEIAGFNVRFNVTEEAPLRARVAWNGRSVTVDAGDALTSITSLDDDYTLEDIEHCLKLAGES